MEHRPQSFVKVMYFKKKKCHVEVYDNFIFFSLQMYELCKNFNVNMFFSPRHILHSFNTSALNSALGILLW